MNNNIITKISEFFIKRSRLSILLILALLTLGFYTYSSVLKREGFPVINIPIILVNTPYFSGDASKTEEKITFPIYEALSELEGIKEVQTTSSDKLSSLVITLEESTENNKEIKDKIETKIKELNLESNSTVVLPNAGFIDGQNDLLFTIYSENLNIEQLQEKANQIKDELNKSPLIKTVNVKEQITNNFDFKQGKEVKSQNSYSRVLINNNGEIKGYDSLSIGVIKKDESIGTYEISQEVQNIVNKTLEKEEFDEINVTYNGDPAISLDKQISSLENNAIAAIITIFLILLFFINWRSAIILAMFIPLTLGAVFLTFTLLGYTLNTISLFALILVLGLFVDDGTIVVEAIDYYKRQGFKGFDAVKKAINDIGVADMSGTLTTVLVFFPLITVTGILGDFIRILPLTVIISLLISLVIALTILPFISLFLIKDKEDKKSKQSLFSKITDFIPNQILKFSEFSGKFVEKILKNNLLKISLFVISLILIGIGGYYASLLSFNFFAPAKDSELISISLTFQPPFSIDNAKAKSIQLENVISDKFESEVLDINYFNANDKSASIRINLTPVSDRNITAQEIVEFINEESKSIEGMITSASIISAGPPSAQFPFAMQIYSEDSKLLEKLTNEINTFIQNQSLSNDLKAEDIKIDYITEVRKSDGLRYAELKVKFNGKSDSATLIELQERVETEFNQVKLEELSKDYSDKATLGFDFGQESDNATSFNSVALAGIISIFVMYAILVLQFNSFTQPILILLAIPFSFPGLFPGLYYTNNPMSFFVVIGLTGLIGIVVNNTIMLIEYANAKRAEGKDLISAISEAVKLRTRPIFATSLTTVAGLVPLALSEPFWEPLAFTIIFGLLSSVFMIMLAFPIYYYFIEGLRERFYLLFKRK